MKDAGYKTFFAGKWHLGSEGSWPTDHGFDINKGGWDVGGPRGGFFSPYTNPNLQSGPDGESLTRRLGLETARLYRKEQRSTLPCLLVFYTVHAPIQTTEGTVEKISETKQKKWGLPKTKTDSSSTVD